MNKEEIEQLLDSKVGEIHISLLCIMSYLNHKFPDFVESSAEFMKKLKKKINDEESKS